MRDARRQQTRTIRVSEELEVTHSLVRAAARGRRARLRRLRPRSDGVERRVRHALRAAAHRCDAIRWVSIRARMPSASALAHLVAE
jgi:hypothetical protein